MATQSLPSTPKVAPAAAPISTPASEGPGTPGKWRHPQLSEVVRRQNAATFNDKNLRSVVWNGATLASTWVFGSTLKSYARRVFDSDPVYQHLPLLLLQALLLFNILLALYPLFKPKDDLADIPLTPTQRALLGLDPGVVPPSTPGTTYVTPPRYRLSTSRKASPASASRQTTSPLTSNSTYTDRLPSSGTPFSPVSSPLFSKAVANGGRESARRLSIGSSSPLARSNSFGESTMSSTSGMSSIGPSTPSPLSGKRRSLGAARQANQGGSGQDSAPGTHVITNSSTTNNGQRELLICSMGASESKLVFKQGIFRLSEEKEIPADDPYWTRFWELPESTEDVFSLFTPADIRRTRDHALSNFETLLLSVSSRLIVLKNHPSFPDPDLAPERDVLNCVRILTRLLPFVYEAEHLEAWEEKFFWARRKKKTRQAQIAGEVLFDEAQSGVQDGQSPRDEEYEDVKPLAEELIDTLLDLLFFANFTIPQLPTAKSKISYSIWQSGVGCNTAMGSNKTLENNRCEVLRLLLTMTGKAMYLPSSTLPVQGVKAITYITTCQDKQSVLTLLCSLLNTAMKYNPAAWRVPYDHVVWKDPKQILVIYSLQLLLVLLLYPIPEDGRGAPPKNYYRHYFGRLHRPQDFQFLVDGMTRILNQPMQATTSYLPGSQRSVKWAPEMLILFWETLQCNKRFRSFIIDSNRSHDFLILCIFYAMEYRTEPSKQGIVRLCIFILQTMSAEPNFGKSLNMKFEAQETLPQSIRILKFRGSYADYLIMSIQTLMTTSKGNLDTVYPALLIILTNVAPHVKHISPSACSKVIQLFSSMSAPSFLLANETNHTLLASLLDFINAVLEHGFTENPYLVYAVLKYKDRFEAVRAFTLESGQQEIERQREKRKAGESSGDLITSPTLSHSEEDLHAPSGARSPLTRIPEENSAFSIGDDDSDDETEEGGQRTPSQSSPSAQTSRRPSFASTIDDTGSQIRGISEKARGKLPAGRPSFSRQNSMTSQTSMSALFSATSSGFTPTVTWLESWLPELPLHTILTLISAIAPHIPDAALQATSSPEARTLIHNLPSFAEEPQVTSIIAEPTPVRAQSFEWSALSMGWYESLLWGFIFSSEMVVGSAAGATPGTVGVWNGTAIRLFRVQEAAAQGPTLLAPKGAVDAVGSNLVQRIGNLSLRGRNSVSQESPSGATPSITSGLQSILKNTHHSKEYEYPTDITRDLLPIPVHSHKPFYTGLSKGCTSTEADVWLYNGTLYVGHDQSALTHERTLESLYINPILDILERQNPKSPFVTSPTKNGVWDTTPDQTLYFFIDVKTSGHETFQAVIEALKPLREKGYLTTLEGGKTLTNGPVTVIGTGNTPLDMVAPIANRDYFFDAPLSRLNDAKYAEVTGLVSPIASTNFEEAVGKITGDTDPILNDDQLKALRVQIATAEKRGIGARYWNTPSWPVRRRNLVWRTLLREGVALLNADDLDSVIAEF
ncbi:Ubp5-interacting protein [Penicillium rolfsii]|nr:Ubp5-interacting protein [Penicillium rolfsii]